MPKESVKIMKRRFSSRIVESGLLIIAVALGVGAAASGISLLFQTNQYSHDMLSSPAYRELVVTTQDNIEDMEQAAVETLKTEYTALTSADLDAAEIIPQVSYAFVTIKTQMGFLTEELVNEKGGSVSSERRESSEAEEDKEYIEEDNDRDEDEQTRKFFDMVETFRKAKENPDFIIPEIEELFGYEVSPQFFDAWNMETKSGSLFTSTDMSSKRNFVVLGSEAAKLLIGEYNAVESLVGKKIISYFNYYTIIGVLKPTDTEYDNAYFAPDTVFAGEGRFDIRKKSMNRQLRFTVTNPAELDDAARLLEDWFETAYGEGQIAVSNPRVEAEKLVNRNRGISILILFLSLAGLFIASVNVSNILMSRSLRMRKHVGILKALGASKNDILKLFAGEAIIITFIGSIVGMGLAFPLANVMEISLDLGQGSWLNILYGVLLSSFLTLLFSILPSWQNSGIEAADAMRSAG